MPCNLMLSQHWNFDCVDIEAAGGGRDRGRGKAGTVRLSVLRTFMPCTLLETLTVLMSRLVVEDLNI